MNSRDYRHLSRAGVSFAVDVSNGTARIAVALCSELDNFNRDTGRTILNHLLDAPPETLNALGLTRNVFSLYYSGKKPRVEVLTPLIESLIDTLNERALYRELKTLFLLGINSHDTAKEVSKKTGDQSFHKRFIECAAVLEAAGDLKMLKNTSTLEGFENNFFSWRGSAEAVLDGVIKFAHNFKMPVSPEKKADEAPKTEETQVSTEASPLQPTTASTPDEDDVVARFLLQRSELKAQAEAAKTETTPETTPASSSAGEPPVMTESGAVPSSGGI